MSLNTFVDVILPYVLIRQDDGSYVAANREYKPVGFRTDEWINYITYPISSKIPKITPGFAERISCRGSNNIESIQLHHGCQTPEELAEYLHRLKLLASLKVS